MKQLYAVAVEHVNPKTRRVVKTEILYLHAPPDCDNARGAETVFRHVHQQALMSGRMRIASVGPVVGFFVPDEKNEKVLTV